MRGYLSWKYGDRKETYADNVTELLNKMRLISGDPKDVGSTKFV